MKREIGLRIGQCDRMDWAVLYLRLFLGSIMLFHNIGKIQNYNELISSYPSLLYIDNNAVFVIATVTEVLFSVLIMMGIWVRLSASVLAAVELAEAMTGRMRVREKEEIIRRFGHRIAGRPASTLAEKL